MRCDGSTAVVCNSRIVLSIFINVISQLKPGGFRKYIHPKALSVTRRQVYIIGKFQLLKRIDKIVTLEIMGKHVIVSALGVVEEKACIA